MQQVAVAYRTILCELYFLHVCCLPIFPVKKENIKIWTTQNYVIHSNTTSIQQMCCQLQRTMAVGNNGWNFFVLKQTLGISKIFIKHTCICHSTTWSFNLLFRYFPTNLNLSLFTCIMQYHWCNEIVIFPKYPFPIKPKNMVLDKTLMTILSENHVFVKSHTGLCHQNYLFDKKITQNFHLQNCFKLCIDYANIFIITT